MFTRNLNLLYNDSFDSSAGGGDPAPEPQVSEAPEGGGGNPAWEDVRSLVDPETFARLQPKLEEWDKGVQQRLGTLTEKYKPYEQLLNGRTPDYLQQAVQFADMLDQAPDQIYERLGEYLRSTGRLPGQQEPSQEQQQPEAESLDEQLPVDPRLSQLEQAQQQMMQMMQAQAQERLRQQAESQLDAEIRQLREKHNLDDEDIQEVIRRAALAAQRVQGTPGARVPTLEEAYQEYQALQNRILSKPRPGDSAPQLVPPGGGASSSQQQKSWGQASKSEMQDAIVALLQGGKQQ